MATDSDLSLCLPSSPSIVTHSMPDLTFFLLSSSREGFHNDVTGLPAVTVQNCDKKCSELRVLQQFLFVKCFTEQSEDIKWLVNSIQKLSSIGS